MFDNPSVTVEVLIFGIWFFAQSAAFTHAGSGLRQGYRTFELLNALLPLGGALCEQCTLRS